MTGREKLLAVICVLLLLLTNLGTFTATKAACPDQQIHLSCPDECPEIPDCECGDCVLEPRAVIAGPGVQCVVQGDTIFCNAAIQKDPDCDELDVEQERRHGVRLGPGYYFHDDNDAVSLEVDWDPKWLQHRNPWVPTTIGFEVLEDVGEYPEPTLNYGIEYQQAMPTARCHYCPVPTIAWDDPDGTRIGVKVKWTAK